MITIVLLPSAGAALKTVPCARQNDATNSDAAIAAIRLPLIAYPRPFMRVMGNSPSSSLGGVVIECDHRRGLSVGVGRREGEAFLCPGSEATLGRLRPRLLDTYYDASAGQKVPCELENLAGFLSPLKPAPPQGIGNRNNDILLSNWY